MYLYILISVNKQKYYIGITTNIEKRVKEHNTNTTHYTGKQNETWILVYKKFYIDAGDARKEEIRLKKAKNRTYIEWYIRNSGA